MPAGTDDVILEVDVDDLSFGVGFTPLNTCKKALKDEWLAVTDVKSWVGSYLKAANASQGGTIGQYVSTRLSPEAQSVLVSYMR